MQEENQAFTAKIAREKELNKRETQRQNIVTMMNMFGSQLASAFASPGFLMKVAYAGILFSAGLHATRMTFGLA